MSNVVELADERMKQFAKRINGETIREQLVHIISMEDELRYFVYCIEHGIPVDIGRVEAAKELIS